MNGVHDMGGMDGFGKVEVELNEPPFHEKWEGRVFAMVRTIGAQGGVNIDAGRFARERIAPATYLASSYYKKWLLGLERVLLERKLVGEDELAAGRSLRASPPLPRGKLSRADTPRVLVRGSYERDAARKPLFATGTEVRARNIHPEGHTRLPRYVRGHLGVIERINGCHVYPDSSAAGEGENPQWLYTVVFSARDLWGEDADPSITISVDAFEPYLEPA